MPIEIIVGAGAQITTIADQEGETWATLVRDTDAIAGRASIIVTAPLGAGGFPVTVVLPVWATRAEIITPSGRGFTLPAGAAVISQDSVGFPDDATSVVFWVRPASDAAHGAWRKRILRDTIPSIVTPPPPQVDRMTLSGALTYSTTGQVGAALTITARPTASRTPSQTETILRLYSALTDGTLSSTVSPAPTTVPNNDTLFGVPVYRVYDVVYNEWIEREATARFDIFTATSSPAAVVQANLTITAAWKAGTGVLRQQAIHTFLCAGSPHGSLLEARIVTERYTTAWTPCVEQAAANVWGFGVAAVPAGQPGAGRNAFEFYDMEDRFKVQFRRRASAAVAWGPVSGNLVFPMPTTGGAEQFNALPTTRAALVTAIETGFAATGPYVIGLSGEIDLAGGTVQVSGLTKTGEPLIIKSVDRGAPVRMRGHLNRCFDMVQCNNFIFDRVNVINDRTAEIGYPEGGVPKVQYAAGQAYMFQGCTRAYICDAVIRDVNVGIELRDCDDIYIGFCELDRIVQDGIRFYRRNGNIILEGEYQHDPVVYDALALSGFTPNYHPDDIQTSCSMQTDWVRPAGQRMGGNRNIRRVRGRSYGVPRTGSRHTAGYWGATGLRDSGRDPGDTNMDTGGARHRNANWLWEDMYIVSTWNAFPLAEAVDGFTMRRCVARKGHPNGRTPQLNLSLWATDIVVDNCVAGGGVYSIPTNAAKIAQGFMTGPEMAAEVTLLNGGMNVSLTAWPTGWTGGETRFPTGPDAYR